MAGADVGMGSISTLRGFRVTLNDGTSSSEKAAFRKAAVEMAEAFVQNENGVATFSYSRWLFGDPQTGEVHIQDVSSTSTFSAAHRVRTNLL